MMCTVCVRVIQGMTVPTVQSLALLYNTYLHSDRAQNDK